MHAYVIFPLLFLPETKIMLAMIITLKNCDHHCSTEYTKPTNDDQNFKNELPIPNSILTSLAYNPLQAFLFIFL